MALGIDVTNDNDEVHPPSLCGSCFRKVRRWKDAQNKKKSVPLNVTVHTFSPHGDSCVICTKSNDSPQKILWEQQKKSATSKPTAMRWRPCLLRMCIALNSKSSSAHNLLRNSGFINLPYQNTLRKYTHFTDSTPGFNKDLLTEIIKEQDLDNQPDFKRNVCLLMDEMKIKSGLVFSASGRLVGFSDLGNINNEQKTFEEYLKGESTKLATHVFVLMVRGIFSGLKAPFAYFPCSNMSSEQLYPCVWEGVKLLEAWGLRVKSITSDGASSNCKFYALCTDDADAYWTRNPFAKDRKVNFIADVPHLRKTLRNNVANSGCHTKTGGAFHQHFCPTSCQI
ncbi:uncharacterized protein LOC135155820 [Lytechinus pictus]|uniref:uncharacterized protein LOC135155820 n=1 Tax=Lytechinus pictus TaxID=7653 RepID=UPI0030B9D30B